MGSGVAHGIRPCARMGGVRQETRGWHLGPRKKGSIMRPTQPVQRGTYVSHETQAFARKGAACVRRTASHVEMC